MKRISTKPEYREADVDYSSVSVKQLKSGKGLLIAIAVISAISDLVAFAVLTLKGFAGWQYSILPLLLFVADIILIGLAIGGNFRMKYSRKAINIYILITAALVAAICVLGTTPLTVMSITAVVVLCVTHVVFWFVAGFGARYARRPLSNRKTAGAAFVLLLTFGISALFIGYNAVLGYYGQGKVYPNYERTVVYKRESDGSYTAKDVLPGKGGAVVIPEKFNGIEVRKVDLKILTYNSVTSVTLEGLSEKEFDNPSQYAKIREDIPVYVSREVIDDYRSTALTYAFTSNARSDILCNAFEPNDLNSDEVSLSFSYRRDKLFNTAANNILPVMIFKKGEVFSETRLSAYSNFVKYNDIRSQFDLKWNYDNNDKYIMDSLLGEDGTPLVGSRILKNMKVDVRFEKIFRLQMTDGNDLRFAPNGKLGEPFYAVTSEAVFTPITREGFTANWSARISDSSDEGQLSSNYTIQNFLTKHGKNGGNEVELIPTWQVVSPVFQSVYSDLYGEITADKNFSFTYGENPVLNCKTLAHDLPLIFRFYRNSTLIKTVESADAAASFDLLNYLPSDSGTYRVSVEADLTNVLTSLSSPVAEKILNVAVDKKQVHLTWTVPSADRLVYDGEEKAVTCAFDLSEGVGTDIFEYTVNGALAVNAGQYDAEVNLIGQTEERYRIKIGQNKQRYDVTQKGVTATWTVESFIYNGLEQRPDAVAYGIEKDGKLNIEYTGAQIRAGENYIVRGTLTDKNYAFLNPEKSFAIAKRPIYVVWDSGLSAQSFIYNGQAQKSVVTEVQNAVDNDKDELLRALTYSDWSDFVNAREYAVTVGFPGQDNYEIASGEERNYCIEKREILPQFDTQPTVYDGESHTAKISMLGEVVNGEEADVRNQFLYSQYAVNVGTYEVVVTLPDNSNYRLGQKTATVFAITKRDLYVQVVSETITYNNAPYTGYRAEVNNLADTDTPVEIGEEVWTGTGVNARNASVDPYTLNLEFTVGAKHGNYSIHYKNGTLSVKRRALQVTVTGGEKVYDGQTFACENFSVQYDNIADGENVAEWSVTYVGSGVTAVKASNNPYSVTAEMSGDSILTNYNTTIVNGKVKINRRVLTPIWVASPAEAVEKVYDGTTVCDTVFTYGKHVTLANAEIGTEITGVKLIAEFDSPDVLRNRFVTVTFGALQTGIGFDAQNYTYVPAQILTFKSQINPRPISITKTAEGNFSKTYDGSETFDGDLLQNGTHFTVTNAVIDQDLSATFTALYNASGVNATKITVTFADLVGNAAFDANNYSYQSGATLEYTASISKRELILCAENKSKVYDNRVFEGAFTFETTGLASGDSIEEVAVVTFIGDALTGMYANETGYEIGIETGTEKAKFANYSITCLPGRLTVAKRTIEVSAIGKLKTYDGKTADGFTVQVTNLAEGDSLADVGLISYKGEGTTNPNRTDIGYTVTPYFEAEKTKYGNYTVTFIDGIVRINPRQITVIRTTDETFTKVYDGTTATDVKFAMGTHYDVDNAVAGEITDVVYTAVYNGKDVRGASVITLTIERLVGERYNPDNYDFDAGTEVTFNATITPREIWGDGINGAPNPSKTYDGNTNFFNLFEKGIHYTVENGVGTEIADITYTADAATASAGQQNVTVTFAEIEGGNGFISTNYTLETGQNSIVLTGQITQKDLVVASDDAEKVYDGQPYAGFTVTVNGLAEGDTLDDVLTVTFGAEILSAKDVVKGGGHAIKFVTQPKTKFINYSVNATYGSLTIQQRSIRFEIVDGTVFTKVYDGGRDYNNQIVYATHYRIIGGVEGEINGAHVIRATYNSPNVTDANTVEVQFGALLGSAQADNYAHTIATLRYEATITPKDTETTWSDVRSVATGDGYGFMQDVVYENAFYYTGNTQAPQATAIGLQGECISIQVTGGAKNAQLAPYTAVAVTTNGNYRLTNTECEFKIVPKKVKPLWSNLEWNADKETWEYDPLRYTGSALSPTMIAEQIFENGTEPTISLSLPTEAWSAVVGYLYFDETGKKLGGAPTDAGTYAVEIVYTTGNYEFIETRQTYQIVESEG